MYFRESFEHRQLICTCSEHVNYCSVSESQPKQQEQQMRREDVRTVTFAYIQPW